MDNGIDGKSVNRGPLSGTRMLPNGGGDSATQSNVIRYLQEPTGSMSNGRDGGSADGPCFDNANRYVNCVNGTVTDT